MEENKYQPTVLVCKFADASHIDSCGQLGVITGLLVGEMKSNSIYYVMYWMSHKYKRPVNGVPAAEILATAEGMYDGKTVAKKYYELLVIDVKLHLCVE